MPITLLAIANFLHLIATMTWIGGMIVARLVIAALAGLPPETRRSAMQAIAERGASYTYGALVIFIITGLAMLSQNPNYAGFFVFATLWTRVILVKHVVIVVLVVSTAYINETVNRKLAALGPGDEAEQARWAERRKDLGDMNFLLGLIILGLTAIATSIPAGG